MAITRSRYLLSGTFRRETTVLPAVFSDQRGSLLFNISNISSSKKFNLQFSGNFICMTIISFQTKKPRHNIISFAPNAPALYNDAMVL